MLPDGREVELLLDAWVVEVLVNGFAVEDGADLVEAALDLEAARSADRCPAEPHPDAVIVTESAARRVRAPLFAEMIFSADRSIEFGADHPAHRLTKRIGSRAPCVRRSRCLHPRSAVRLRSAQAQRRARRRRTI